MAHPLSETFFELSSALKEHRSLSCLGPDSVGLASALGLIDRNGACNIPDASNTAALLSVASRLPFFQAHACRSAPGAHLFVAKAEPSAFGFDPVKFPAIGVAGCGDTRMSAFESCLGEAVEHLSMLEREGDIVQSTPINVLENYSTLETTDAVTAHSVSNGLKCHAPADLCLVRTAYRYHPEWRVSNGCAASRTQEQAIVNGLFELIERDAISRWWFGDVTAKLVAADDITKFGIFDFMEGLRHSRPDRTYRLLDIRSTFDLPVIAAFSFNKVGRGFAGGYAASLNPVLAMRSAITEMIQMEVGQDIVTAKESRMGVSALNQADLRHKMRSSHISANSPKLLSGETQDYPVAADADSVEMAPLTRVAEMFSHAEIPIWHVNLTRDEIGIPVAKMIASGLTPLPSDALIDADALQQKPDDPIPLF